MNIIEDIDRESNRITLVEVPHPQREDKPFVDSLREELNKGFTMGGLVKLKSGGEVMCLHKLASRGFERSNDTWECVWHDRNGVCQKGNFDTGILVHQSDYVGGVKE